MTVRELLESRNIAEDCKLICFFYNKEYDCVFVDLDTVLDKTIDSIIPYDSGSILVRVINKE